MLLIITEIILWVILCSSLGMIFFILIKKFPLVANIDLEKIPKEKMAQTKKHLLKKQLQRTINRQVTSLKNKLIVLKNKLKKRQ